MHAQQQPRLTLALAERCSCLAYEAMPHDVVEIARQALLDWFGVTLGGSSEDGPTILLEVLAGDGASDHGTATVMGHAVRLSALHAALVNGTSSHALDFDDVNLALPGHVSVAILAGALALAEQLDANGRELLTAFVAGYETACRIAVALGPAPYLRGFHATGTIGTFGSAAACARLLGLDAPRTAAALGVAASQAAGLKGNFGTMTKSFHAGKACENGLLAALLSARGFTAGDRAIEGEQAFAAIAAGGCDADAALSTPDGGWHIRGNLFKHHASCFFTHSMLEGLRELTDSRSLAAADIGSVALHVSDVELGACVIPAPSTGLEVKFSMAHLAAMALAGRSTASVTDADAEDADLIALRSKVSLFEDGVAGQPTLVELVLNDGAVLSARHDVNAPERDLAAQRGRLSEKFLTLAAPALGAAGAARLLGALGGLEEASSVRALMACARPVAVNDAR